ncbi:PIN2/TERF1-interacting telomerase inhibitor 1 [Anopheles cruzii]|uniref:PIN2/TERF1-interacting telomerase inhibitor 1 n=1 Tax=Anopheles cruzii TaxID=68878 RepID=UPI0022EC60D4|nr:PIN2/TERF1-interacting telomerase inhibitor 1 [Anopheles cruzii]
MDGCLGSVLLPSMKVRQKKLCKALQKPKAQPVFKDASNVGARMLAKLGWSEGKGLGKKEDGMLNPILPQQKRDNEGVGYAGEDDSGWTQHDAGFNELLKRLNGGGEETTAEAETETVLDSTTQLQSLEERSKKSRARVHYRKFTRGKDLSQVNEKDLANIFGKRSMAEMNKPANEAKSNDASADGSEHESETEKTILGLTTIKSSLSMQEYFQQKMKMKQAVMDSETIAMDENRSDLHDAEPEIVKTKKKKSKKNKEVVTETQLESLVTNEEASEESTGTTELPKETKRKHQSKEVHNHEEPSEPVKKKKKSKKGKSEAIETESTENLDEDREISNDSKTQNKKKTSRKSKHNSDETDSGPTTSEEVSSEIMDPNMGNSATPDVPEPTKKQKKSKKTKKKEATSEEGSQDPLVDEDALREVADHDGKDHGEASSLGQLESYDAAAIEEALACPVKVAVLKHLDETAFIGSNFANIIGYRLTEDVKLVQRDDTMRRKLEKHRFATQKNVSHHRKWQKLKKVSAFEAI